MTLCTLSKRWVMSVLGVLGLYHIKKDLLYMNTCKALVYSAYIYTSLHGPFSALALHFCSDSSALRCKIGIFLPTQFCSQGNRYWLEKSAPMHLRCIKCQQKCNYIIYMTIIPECKQWAGPTSIKCSTSLLWQVKNLNISQRTPTLWAFMGAIWCCTQH